VSRGLHLPPVSVRAGSSMMSRSATVPNVRTRAADGTSSERGYAGGLADEVGDLPGLLDDHRLGA
jgi:hypothetical protein